MIQARLDRPGHRGLTLIEVLVVIAVIGILVSLLLPAVMSARSASRKAQCGNNLKQLATAVHQFHDRNGSMPTYWGPMKNAGGELFGPWLMHLLPDLGEQNLFDQFLPSPGETYSVEVGTWTTGTMIAPAIPASLDYNPGTVVTSTVGVVNYVGISIPVVTSQIVGQTGTPQQGPWFDQTYTATGTVSAANNSGLHPKFDDIAAVPVSGMGSDRTISLNVLQCSDDTSPRPANGMQPGRGGRKWGLTNYMANAHVFMKFGPCTAGSCAGGRILSGTSNVATEPAMGGRFPRALGSRVTGAGVTQVTFTHAVSGSTGLPPRQFAHIVDGLSNTIMFGEGMRQCDNGNSFRFAFLPTAERGDEHSFGIDVAVTGTAATSIQWGDWDMAFGNTLMFQQRSPQEGCNKYRLQANHEVLNVAMCDGSVRGISPRVTRREACDPDVAGREYGRDAYNPAGLGGIIGTNVSDGIWDMLMVPVDPPGNVLANTGEIGREK